MEEKNLYFYHPDHLGSSSYITDKNGEVIQHTEYIAFGEVLVDEHSTSIKQPYLFNGKELDYETGLYYYGARYYDAKTSLWLNTDPLSGYNPVQEVEHYIDGQHNGGVFNFGNLNTYIYTYQNPIRYIDPNGKQSISNILVGRVTKSSVYFQFKPATVHLLSLVSGVNKELISNAIIVPTGSSLGKTFNIPVPLYNPKDGGGITLPDEYGLGINRIIYTKNFFSDDNIKYNGNAYANKMIDWLDISSHEVGHLAQIEQYNGNYKDYVSTFISQYAKSGSNDGAKFEIQAEKGTTMFRAFNKYVNKNYGKNRIGNLFSNPNNKQDDIIYMIDKWWNNFKKTKENEKVKE